MTILVAKESVNFARARSAAKEHAMQAVAGHAAVAMPAITLLTLSWQAGPLHAVPPGSMPSLRNCH